MSAAKQSRELRDVAESLARERPLGWHEHAKVCRAAADRIEVLESALQQIVSPQNPLLLGDA